MHAAPVTPTPAVARTALPPLPSGKPAPKPIKIIAKAPKPGTASKVTSSKPRAHTGDDASRRLIAGGPTMDDITLGAESPELRALHDAERELFPPAMPAVGTPWPDQMPYPLATPEGTPHVHASGLPPAPVPSTPPPAEGGKDLSWLAHLELPTDLPVHWDPRVVRYLEFFKDDPRGRQLFTYWLRRSGRYRDAIRKTLRGKSLPEDLLWLSMIESGFDPAARSPAGAMGLWQFMPETARLYGMSVDRWSDQRLSPQTATDAAADFLADLYRRFGSWDLAIAAYNMGYGGLVSVVRRYNTNDFWSLVRLEGAVPWETTLYVPKLLAIAVIGHNLHTFGYADVTADPPVENDVVDVPPGTSLASVANAAGCPVKDVEALNLELRSGRTPPADPGAPASSDGAPAAYPVRVPIGKGAQAKEGLAKLKRDQAPLERYVVRFGESIEQIAAARKVPLAKLVELNAIAQGEVVRGGTVLLVPKLAAGLASPSPADAAKSLPVVVVPQDVFVYPDRKRVFYRVLIGDTLPSVAASFHVSVDDLRRWNDLDPVARLQEGMTLQAFVPPDIDLSRVMLLGENDVRTLATGSEDFFAYYEGAKGRKRLTVTAKAGETLDQIGRRYQVSGGMMERVNHRTRTEALKDGDVVIVYTPPSPANARDTSPGGPVLAAPPSSQAPFARPTAELPPLPSIEELPELP